MALSLLAFSKVQTMALSLLELAKDHMVALSLLALSKVQTVALSLLVLSKDQKVTLSLLALIKVQMRLIACWNFQSPNEAPIQLALS